MLKRLFLMTLMAMCWVPKIYAQTPFLLDKGSGTTGDGLIYQSTTGATTGFIGIKTSTPRQALEVNGPIIAGGLYNKDYVYVGNQSLSFNYDPNSSTVFNSNAYSYIFAHTTGQTSVNPNDGIYVQILNPSGSYINFNALSILHGGNVGIGTASPTSLFSVGASSQFQVSSTGAVTAPSMTLSGTASAATFSGSGSGLTGIPYSAITGAPAAGVASVFGRTGAITAASGDYSVNQITGAAPLASPIFIGNVGIGTSSPGGPLDVTGGSGGFVVTGANLDPAGNTSLSGLANSAKLLEGWNRSAGGGEIDLISNRANGDIGGFSFYDYANNGSLTSLVTFQGGGNVGIGTVPSAKLEVNGNVKLTAGSGASVTFPDGTVQATAWNGTTLGGDYAESVDVLGDRKTYEPGDLIVIDASSPGKFEKSSATYSRLVAGVFSTKPGLVGRRVTAARPDKEAEVPMAMMGIVPTKVSTENGPIEPGDLLVTSSTPGYAMKATDPSRTMGAVIGKALAPLKAGSGVIEVLIALQ